ncbi:MAG TPA: cytidine deaminase [Chthoniobacterales bacterium]|nr:cytidine deaminase [Chthoniobacterales bacterium]
MREAALAALANAYCPYSKFPVGAAVLTENGEIFGGCNVENASYGLTICAERNAIFHAISNGHRNLIAIAVVTPSPQPMPPCGACRQVIHEFNPEADVLCFGQDTNAKHFKVSELLMAAFSRHNII